MTSLKRFYHKGWTDDQKTSFTSFIRLLFFNKMSNLTNNGATPFADVGYPSLGFVIISAALVFIMTPGLGFFYSGLSSAKSANSLIMLSMLSMAVVTIQWFLFGFSLSFSQTGSTFIGNADFFAFSNVGASAFQISAPGIPAVAFALYQLMFATITPAIIFGSVSERVKIMPSIVFLFIWATLVYNPIAYWTWANFGWIRNMSCIGQNCGIGGFDFAGGGPVHMSSGFAGLAFSLFLGKRNKVLPPKPHNIPYVFLGTALLWFGWFGFNGGSALAATPRAAMAATVTTICTSFSAMTWMLLDFISTKKASGVSFCSGAVTGLVVITPASGFVAPWASAVMGIIGTVFVYLCVVAKNRTGLFEDTLDAFTIHGLGGFIGNILTGIFHQKWIPLLDGTVTPGGAIDGNPLSIGYQLAGSLSIASYSFVVTLLILFVLSRFMNLSYTHTDMEKGADLAEMGEVAYQILPSSTSGLLPLLSSSTTSIGNSLPKSSPMPPTSSSAITVVSGEINEKTQQQVPVASGVSLNGSDE